MSGIPIYTQSPINAAKASGITPQTSSAPPVATVTTLGDHSASMTATPSTTSYTPAKPGAPAIPAPTAAAQRYVPVQPTPTQKPDEGPPPPQPGAFPVPTSSMRSNLPPPPRAGETYVPTQTSMPMPYPTQMSVPPPTSAFRAQPPSSTTSTTTAPSSSYPVPLPSNDYDEPRQSLEHPPGYVQNPYASNFTAEQRAAQDAQESSAGGYGSSGTGSNAAALGVDPEGVWNTAKKWAATAGEKLSETEAEIWKRVNGEK